MSLTSYADVVVPAEQGTTTLLRSALTVAGPQLEIVVVTSSVAAVVDTVLHRNEPGGYVYTEADVAVTALETAERAEIARRSKAGEEEGDVEAQAEVSAGLMYAASKIAAERAVWAFVRENQVRVLFSMSKQPLPEDTEQDVSRSRMLTLVEQSAPFLCRMHQSSHRDRPTSPPSPLSRKRSSIVETVIRHLHRPHTDDPADNRFRVRRRPARRRGPARLGARAPSRRQRGEIPRRLRLRRQPGVRGYLARRVP